MFINSLFLAISSSIDSLGIGITYGIKNTKISFSAKFVLFFIALIISILSIWLGGTLKYFLPTFITLYLGNIILITMGLFMVIQSLKEHKKEAIASFDKDIKFVSEEKIYSFFIKCLGITIKIIKNPNSSDFDNSNSIDCKEALFLGFALSLDSFCIGIGFSMLDFSSFLFPFFISFFQLAFLNLGNYFGRKIHKFSKLPDNVWSFISGLLLIIIGLI